MTAVDPTRAAPRPAGGAVGVPTPGARASPIARARAAWVAAWVASAACGGPGAPAPAAPELPPASAAERMLAMLPDGAQVVVELDLARLRGNPVVGGVVARALDTGVVARALPGDAAAESPWAAADQVVLAAYGVGGAEAATIGVLAAPRAVAGATPIADGYYAVGPPAWVEQIQQRVALAGTGEAGFAIHAAPELLALRARAMPSGAPGASLRITARLAFDARIALARMTGLDAAPAQVSAWGDVADDLALVVDCDASDPGSAPRGKPGEPARRLAATVRGVLAAAAGVPQVRLLGLPASLSDARLALQGSWVRTIIAIGPAHLRRVVARAAGLVGAPPPSTPPGDPPS